LGQSNDDTLQSPVSVRSKFLRGVISLPSIKKVKDSDLQVKLNQIVSTVNFIKEKDLIDKNDSAVLKHSMN
jgi:hypothetical protein